MHFGVTYSAMTPTQTNEAPPAPFVGVTEIATRLGVHRNTVYRLFDTGQLPAIRVGARRKVAREVFEDYLTRAAA